MNATQNREWLESTLKKYEDAMAHAVHTSDLEGIETKLMNLTELIAWNPSVIEKASILYDSARLEIANHIMANETLLKAKQDVQKIYIQGKLAAENAMFLRAERACRDIINCIEGLRSILSFKREQIRNNI